VGVHDHRRLAARRAFQARGNLNRDVDFGRDARACIGEQVLGVVGAEFARGQHEDADLLHIFLHHLHANHVADVARHEAQTTETLRSAGRR
jgi:ribonuclease BN (tRNA processing enzyme)